MTITKAYLNVNAKHGKRFVLKDSEGHQIATAKDHFWSSIWNSFFGWLVSIPTTFEMSVKGEPLALESKIQVFGSKYDIVVGEQKVASLSTQNSNYQQPYKVEVGDEALTLVPYPANTYFELRTSDSSRKLLALRRDVSNPSNYVFAADESISLPTATGLCMAILDSFKKNRNEES